MATSGNAVVCRPVVGRHNRAVGAVVEVLRPLCWLTLNALDATQRRWAAAGRRNRRGRPSRRSLNGPGPVRGPPLPVGCRARSAVPAERYSNMPPAAAVRVPRADDNGMAPNGLGEGLRFGDSPYRVTR